jgi:hypothetical protein
MKDSSNIDLPEWMDNWPDGTVKSFDNAFLAYFDGQPSVFAPKKGEQCPISCAINARETLQRKRTTGEFVDISLPGSSQAAKDKHAMLNGKGFA